MRFKLSVLLIVSLLGAACASGNAATTPTSEPTTGTPAATTTSSTAPVRATFMGADGVESTIEDTSRIVTLSGDLTETVYKLGFGD